MSASRTAIRYPHSARPAALSPRKVAKAYGYPIDRYTGRGQTVGIIELGGGFRASQILAYLQSQGVTYAGNLLPKPVDGGHNAPDGPNGADGEVQLDIEIVAAVAPGANINVYFAGNTDQAFEDAVRQAVADGCDIVSISWGGPESSWDSKSIDSFSQVFADAKAQGVLVFVAAGDTGADDGTGHPTCDYPASDPSVIACGGTRLTLTADGTRSAEVVWDDSDTQSATGGGVSRVFPGRDMPDIAGNADPDSGYTVAIDGQAAVIGGTSAVAPLYAALAALLGEALGGRLGSKVDFLGALEANPSVLFDVTSGDNGAYRAGPGRDETTGLGVVDGGKLLAVLETVAPTPPASAADPSDAELWAAVHEWAARSHQGTPGEVAHALTDWATAKGLSA